MSSSDMSPEATAAHILTRALQRAVEVHDTGRKPGMYDLRVGPEDAPEIAIECVGAVDAIRAATWNVGPSKGPIKVAVVGDWHVVLEPDSRVKHVLRRIETILQRCEEQRLIEFVPVDHILRQTDQRLYSDLAALRIDSINCFRYPGSGEVHLGMTGIGGAVDSSGSRVPEWISEFLRAPQQADVLRKLERSHARECHVYIPVTFGAAPWPVESYLGTSLTSLPSRPPDLPEPVLVVWLTYGSNGLAWDGSVWKTFDASRPFISESGTA